MNSRFPCLVNELATLQKVSHQQRTGDGTVYLDHYKPRLESHPSEALQQESMDQRQLIKSKKIQREPEESATPDQVESICEPQRDGSLLHEFGQTGAIVARCFLWPVKDSYNVKWIH